MVAEFSTSEILKNAEIIKYVSLNAPRDSRERELDTIALYLFHNLVVLEPVLKSIKQALNHPNPIVWRLWQWDQAMNEKTRNLFKMLRGVGFLMNLHEDANGISTRIIKSKESNSFLTGNWLERATRIELGKLEPNIAATNVVIRLKDGRKEELDAVFSFGNKKFWIEMTTGEIYPKIEKMKTLHGILGIPRDRCFVITSNKFHNQQNVIGAQEILPRIIEYTRGYGQRRQMAPVLYKARSPNNYGQSPMFFNGA